MHSLLKSRKFWLAVFGVVQTIIFYCIPEFPKEVWQSISALIAVLIAAIALEDAGAKMGGNNSA